MKKHALLVGVEDYRDKMISRLNFARADANALAERLSDRCGFDTVRILADNSGDDEPLLVNIVTALRDMSVELRQDDLFLFFFAGHGVEKDGHGYLLARDSLQAFPEHGSLSLELLRKTFEHLGASKRILLLDACRNSPDAGRADAANCMGDVISRDIVAAARSKLTGGTTTALLSACRSGQRAYEWPGKGHGVFTQYLVEGLDGAAWSGDELEFDRLAGYAAGQVRQWAAKTPGLPIPQEPWYEKFGDPDSIVLAVGQPAATVVRAKPASAPSKPKPSVSRPVARWWIAVGGQERGPLDDAAVREGIRDGSISRDTECWRDRMDQWQPIGKTAEWADAFPPLRKTPAVRPPARKPAIQLPDFLKPVADAQYARLGGLNAGSEAAQKRQIEWVEKGYPLEAIMKETGIVFRLVPPGEFQMGASPGDSEAYDDEKPQHKVTIASPLYVAKFPVTQQQWQAAMGENPAHFQPGCILQERKVKKSFWSAAETVEQEEKRLEADTKEHPVENVSWKGCQGYLNRVHDRLNLEFGKSIRLLTEAEWEYACRGGTSDSRYGNLDAIGWFGGNSGSLTHPVGQKRPNAWGLHDMIGNVYEWCEDTWHDGYKNAPTDGSAWSGGESARVLRGGRWIGNPQNCRSSNRSMNVPGTRNGSIGFRVVVDAF